MTTIVDALRNSPAAANALIEEFTAAHDPAAEQDRAAAVTARREQFNEVLRAVSAIDDDRILRLLGAVVAATVRTNAFAPSGREAQAFKFDVPKGAEVVNQ